MNGAPLLFNPLRAAPDELDATLVARRPLLDALTSDLLADARKKTRRHWQILGARGSGKSHLTELLARRLASAHGWSVARLPEEHLRVGSLGELLEQIVVRLEGADVSPLAHIADPLDLEDAALARIRTWRRERGAPILVVLENLDDVFEHKLRGRRDQGRLRQILSHDPPFAFVGTATHHVDRAMSHDAPFYDFFQTCVLEAFTTEEAWTLVEARARWDGDPALLAALDDVHGRVRALHHFVGGNPRLLLALYGILRRGPSADPYRQLLELLDDVTPAYVSRLVDISSQMARVLAELGLARRSQTPADVALRCRIPVNQVTANIVKLQAARLVHAAGRPDGRRRYYEVSDRLFRLWMQMREEQTAPRRTRSLVAFYRGWYVGVAAGKGRAATALAALLDAAVAGASLDDRVARLLAQVQPAELEAAFVECIPGIVRADGVGDAALRVYRTLRDRAALPADLEPYATALDVTDDPAQRLAVPPETREAIDLLLAPRAQPADQPSRKRRLSATVR